MHGVPQLRNPGSSYRLAHSPGGDASHLPSMGAYCGIRHFAYALRLLEAQPGASLSSFCVFSFSACRPHLPAMLWS